jgi:hypothetical protein
MIINDTTFLMDESLENLKKINEIEQLLADGPRFAQLSDEEKKAKHSALEESMRSVRSWVVLGNETMEMFVTFTHDAPDVFRSEILGDRIAEMLNHNIVKVRIRPD